MELSNILHKLLTFLFQFFLIVPILWVVQYHWKRRKLYAAARQFSGPKSNFFFGSAFLFLGSTHNILDKMYNIMRQYPSPVKIWIGNCLYLCISKPEEFQIVLTSSKALGKSDDYKYSRAVAGEGLFLAPVPKWKKHRKIIGPTLNNKMIASFVDVFVKHADILVDVLKTKTGRQIDVFEYNVKYTLDIFCETSMGVHMNSQRTNSKFGHWVSTAMGVILQRMFKMWYRYDYIFYKTTLGKEFKEMCDNISEFTKKVIKNRKEIYSKKQKESRNNPEAAIDEDGRKTFLDRLMELSEEGIKFTDDELKDEVQTFLIAASDTTASTSSFVFLMLGMHPNIQQKVYEEVVNVLGQDRPVDYADLNEFKYMEMVIKETMRLFPIGPLFARLLTDDLRLGEKTLPAGAVVVLLVLNCHRNAKYWPDPLKFDPNRFQPEAINRRHPYTYIPFSGGPRNCIGNRFAMVSMKIVFATIIRKFKITTHYKDVEEIKLKQDLVLMPLNDFGINLELRE